MTQTTDNQNEFFIVVDAQDRIITHKTRGECHANRNLIHRAINVALFNSKGRIALQKRSATKDLYPSFYALSATGHVGKGESYEQAAYREMEEELGVKGVSLSFVAKQIVETEAEREMVTLFKGFYDGQFDFFEEEVASMHWFGKEEIRKIQKTLTPCSLNSLKLLHLL